MHRLFVALRPPHSVLTELIDVMGGISGARWQDASQLHITLRYIGEVERRIAEDVAAALDGVRASPLTIAVSGTGAFTDARRGGGAVWAGVSPHDAVTALHHKVDRALVRAGLPPERRAFLPHITLARLPRSAAAPDRFLADTSGLSTAPFTLDHFFLFESHLSRDGSSYEAVARYPLIA